MFRKAALAKLSSPEQLDSLLQVTTPKGWIALWATLVLIFAGLVWGILGRTAERVSGAGILITEGGIFGVESRGGGILTEVLVDVGDVVDEGQVVATVRQIEVSEQIRQLEQMLAEQEANRARAVELIERNRDAQLRSLREERDQLRQATASLQNQVKFLESRLAAQTEAVKLGLITNDVRQATAQQLESTLTALIANEAQMAQLDARQATTRNSAQQQIFQLDQEIRRTSQQLELTELRFEEASQVLSPKAGQVVSRLVDAGQEVRPGQAILYIELTGQPLQALAFIPLQGARIRPGMVAQMSPEGITWEEYGYMLGEVVSVAQGPANPDSMNRVLRNQQLIQQFTQSGSVYEVKIKPHRDEGTPSGFKWTSVEGPSIQFGSGTLLRVQIPVEEKRPIALVIPTVRRWIGI